MRVSPKMSDHWNTRHCDSRKYANRDIMHNQLRFIFSLHQSNRFRDQTTVHAYSPHLTRDYNPTSLHYELKQQFTSEKSGFRCCHKCQSAIATRMQKHNTPRGARQISEALRLSAGPESAACIVLFGGSASTKIRCTRAWRRVEQYALFRGCSVH